MKNINIIITIILSMFLWSCFEDDTQVEPLPIEEIVVPYSVYEYQTYVDLSNGLIVSYHNYVDWDLGFESSTEGHHIILNYARFMYAGNTSQTNLDMVKSDTEAEMYFDKSDGNLDSTVFNSWADFTDPDNPVFNNYVYIVDRGKDEQGNSFGYKKIIIEKLESDTFYLHFANLDGTEESSFMVPKDTSVNYTLFSFDNGGQIIASEPNKDDWDICLTKYTTIIPDNNGVLYDYIVRGALLNPYKEISVGLDTDNYFYDITADMIGNYSYSNARDAIGYDWKDYDSQEDLYLIRENTSFILKNVNGSNYKLRFTDFYLDGTKGYPAFELIEF